MRWLIPAMLCVTLNVAAADLPVLVYHDIVRNTVSDHYAITESLFREQMEYLHDQGYRPISLGTYLSAVRGEASLPDKPVMLTFDDGLTSFQEIVLPILERFEYPAILSVTTGWLDRKDIPDQYRDRLLSADALRHISHSPLVDILSHTDRLHQGVVADPMGNQSPAAVARRYQQSSGYESDKAYRDRLRTDLAHSAQRLATLTGRSPRGIAWPYGHYNAIGQEEATRLGMVAQLTLDDRPADVRAFPRINRLLLYKIRTLADFEETLLFRRPKPPVRLIEVALDDLAGQSADEATRWIRQLVTRVRLMRVNTVVVNPFSRDGRQVFFSNSSIPVANDILHAVLHQLQENGAIHRLFLLLPANVKNKSAFQDLARRHPYDGIVLTGDWAPGDIVQLRDNFERYRPGMVCGVSANDRVAGCSDYLLHTVTVGEAFSHELQALRPGPGSYVLIRFPARPSPSDIETAFKELRQANIRDYGIVDRTDLNAPNLLRQVAVELSRHVPPERGD
jgi:poly-beta-1,6-N-acetyl-D-glucosamine N-deacetylase PgaB